jgi:hypothetical protein
MASISRNAPCPCGSGKKYKKCCLLQQSTERPQARDAIGFACRNAISLLLDYSLETRVPLTSTPLGRPVPELPSEEARNGLQQELLMVWLCYLWFPPDSADQTVPSTLTAAARFLKEKGHAADELTRRFIEAARREPFSYWQVEDVSPGSGVLLKDLVTGEERFVADFSLSRSAAKWEIVFAQVVGLDGLNMLNGLGVYSLPPAEFRERVVEFANQLRKRIGKAPDRLSLLNYQTECVTRYLGFLDDILNPKLPELFNTDGDKLVQAKSVYTFDPARREDVLKAVQSLRDEPEAKEKDGVSRFVWLAMPKTPGHTDKVVKGRYTIGPGSVETECNSEARDKALRLRLQKSLGSLLTHDSTHLEPLHPEKLAQKSRAAGKEKSGKLDLSTLSAEDRVSLEAALGQRYMAWLDEKVPLLGGKTPREVARTPAGNAQVADLINDWENMQERNPNPQFAFDFNRLRLALGLPPE